MTDRPINATGGTAAASPPLRDAAVKDFIALLKPRVMSLVVFTGFAGMMVAPGSIHPVIAAVAILCTAIATGASGAINMWFERDLDAKMERTKNRPLPGGRMEPEAALTFGCVLAGGSVMVMGLGVNWAAAALLALAIGFYVFVYTIWLKRRTPQNIVIGGAAGAFPPMIGWAAVTGDVSFGGIALFALIFMWTPPWWIGLASAAWGALAAAFGLAFVGFAVKVWFDTTDRAPRQMFRFSLLYLTVLFAALIVDNLIGRFVGPVFGA